MAHQFQELIDSLPERQGAGSGWRRTKVAPCAILMKCSECGEHLTPDHFSKANGHGNRRMILGPNRKSTCRSCENKRFLKSDHRKKLLHSAKQRAKEKGLPFDLTVDDIVIPERCPALGISLVPSVGEGRKTLTKLNSSPSIDRIDNSKGYTKDNVCVISLRANNVKKDATLQELHALVTHMESEQHFPVKDVSARLLVEASEIAERKMANRITSGTPIEQEVNTLPCSRCKQSLPIDKFTAVSNHAKGRKAPDGTRRISHCKKCSVEVFLIKDHRVKLLNAARRRSKAFGLDFNIVKEDIPIPEFCPVFGIKLEPSVGEGRKDITLLNASPSIDRIDSSKGYTKGNVQVISFRANNLKKDATLQEMKALVRYVESFQRGVCK
jgi:ribosomal protein L32